MKHEMDWTPLHDLLEAVIAVVLLGITVAALYRLIIGEVPWTFFVGEVIGLGMGVSLLMVATPRRRRR